MYMTHGSLSFSTVLKYWRMFCDKPPKGFEKYFNPSSGSKPPDKKLQDNKSPEADKNKNNDLKPKGTTDWHLGMFGQNPKQKNRTSGGGGPGRPIGGDGNDREKWLLLGAAAAVALIGSFAFFEMGYKEIGWKEFVNR